MFLWVVRHGKAKPDSPSGQDFDRPLRKRGLMQVSHLAGFMQARADRPVAIIASEAVRARDTAVTLGASLDVEPVFDARLLVDEPVEPVLDLVCELAEFGQVAIVGHNPQLERVVAIATSGPTAPSTRLRTGEAVLLRFDPDFPAGGAEEILRERLAGE